MWVRIKQINWPNRWKDENAFESAKQFILDNYSEDECVAITEFVEEKHALLSERVKEFERTKRCTCGNYLGTDSFNDMIAQVIGNGEECYKAIFENPYGLKEIRFYESFMYCLPHFEDFEIRNETNECVIELNRIITETGNNAVIANLMQRFRLMLSGDFKGATNDLNPTLYDNMRFFTGNDCNAKFANLIRDCNKFYVSY